MHCLLLLSFLLVGINAQCHYNIRYHNTGANKFLLDDPTWRSLSSFFTTDSTYSMSNWITAKGSGDSTRNDPSYVAAINNLNSLGMEFQFQGMTVLAANSFEWIDYKLTKAGTTNLPEHCTVTICKLAAPAPQPVPPAPQPAPPAPQPLPPASLPSTTTIFPCVLVKKQSVKSL